MLLHAYAPFRQIVESRRCTLKTINARLERRTSTEYAEKSLPFIIRAWFRNIRGILTVITTATNFRCTVSRMRKFIVLSDQPRGTCINAVHVFAVYSREKNLSPTFKTVASVDTRSIFPSIFSDHHKFDYYFFHKTDRYIRHDSMLDNFQNYAQLRSNGSRLISGILLFFNPFPSREPVK